MHTLCWLLSGDIECVLNGVKIKSIYIHVLPYVGLICAQKTFNFLPILAENCVNYSSVYTLCLTLQPPGGIHYMLIYNWVTQQLINQDLLWNEMSFGTRRVTQPVLELRVTCPCLVFQKIWHCSAFTHSLISRTLPAICLFLYAIMTTPSLCGPSACFLQISSLWHAYLSFSHDLPKEHILFVSE